MKKRLHLENAHRCRVLADKFPGSMTTTTFEQAAHGCINLAGRIEVTDAGGKAVLTLLFSETLQLKTNARAG